MRILKNNNNSRRSKDNSCLLPSNIVTKSGLPPQLEDRANNARSLGGGTGNRVLREGDDIQPFAEWNKLNHDMEDNLIFFSFHVK